MATFIEITTGDGQKKLVNLDHVMLIVANDDAPGSLLILRDEGVCVVKAPYDRLKSRIIDGD